MRDDQLALNNAVGIQLAFDADRIILRKAKVCRELQPLLGNVHDVAKGTDTIFRHETAPGHRHAELSALRRRHRLHPSGLA